MLSTILADRRAKTVPASRDRSLEKPSLGGAGWRIRADAFCRHVCAVLERTLRWAPTSRQKASRRMRHPIFINFRGPEAHGDRVENATSVNLHGWRIRADNKRRHVCATRVSPGSTVRAVFRGTIRECL